MSDEKIVKISIGLDDESKALLKANTSALLASASANGSKPAAKPAAAAPAKPAVKPTKPKAAPEPEADEDDGDGEEAADDEETEEPADEEEGPTLDTVGEAMKAYATSKGPGGAGSKAAAMALLQKHGGVDKLSALKAAKFEAVITALTNATAKLKKKPAK